jgi:DNA repair protein RadC
LCSKISCECKVKMNDRERSGKQRGSAALSDEELLPIILTDGFGRMMDR